MYPPISNDPEYRIPETADLRGLAYDYTDHSLITYDQVEKKLLWISRDDASVRASVLVDSPVDSVLGMSQFNDFVYILSYEGDGRLAVFTGSLQQGRSEGVLKVTRFEVPYSAVETIGQTQDIWDMTHAPVPRWLKYHPDFCNIFNIGPTVYLLIGLAKDVTPDSIPTELGQYIVEFNLNGLFRNQVKVDLSSKNRREETIGKLNGLAKACAYHDGVMSMLCRELNPLQPNIIHAIKHRLGEPLEYDSFWYLCGKLKQGTAMLVAGRWMYTLIDGRIYRSEIMMIKLHMQNGWPNTQTLDLGNLSSGQVTFRKVRCQNIAPVTTYHDLTISARDSLLLLSVEDRLDEHDYTDKITIPGILRPGDTFDFCVCLTAPTVDEDTFTPYQFYDRLTFHPRKKTEYDFG